jgi:glutamate synthase domain-containing protein 1
MCNRRGSYRVPAERHLLEGDSIEFMKSEHGLSSPGANRGACGVGALINLNGTRTHQLVEDGLRILCNLDHRGARGAEEKTGDGAGMLLQKPHDFFHSEIPTLGDFDSYGVGQLFVQRINGSRSH